MMILLTLNLMMSTFFVFVIHPLSLGMILLIQTLLISLITGMLNLNFWYSYIIFLILIGGMLILFIYMTSIASNEKFKFNTKLILLMILLASFIILLNSFQLIQFNKTIDYSNWISFSKNQISFTKFASYPNYKLILFLFIYLLITLIACVKITHFKKGPLRQSN
uniref:NADH-ubiquinone oxidoreductase chain 6 n=1 Tax=Osphya bipunctata TaxID=1227470 RepID=S4SWB0_9CUCU|nr:NADH dehydrogenase subunit 6 [Osphya bipunctata]